MQNAIGGYTFLDLAGNPQTVQRMLELFALPGVDGVTVVDTGTRGRPFVLRSKVDLADLATAGSEYASYLDLIGDDPVDLVWQNLAAPGGVRYVVLDVLLVRMVPLVIASGGINPPAFAWLECDWTLVPVAV